MTRDILVNLVADFIFAGLALAYRRMSPGLMRRDPRVRPVALLALALLWAVANVGYVSTGIEGYALFLLFSSACIGYVVGDEMYRMWRVGIMGADPEAAKGLSYAPALRLCTQSL